MSKPLDTVMLKPVKPLRGEPPKCVRLNRLFIDGTILRRGGRVDREFMDWRGCVFQMTGTLQSSVGILCDNNYAWIGWYDKYQVQLLGISGARLEIGANMRDSWMATVPAKLVGIKSDLIPDVTVRVFLGMDKQLVTKRYGVIASSAQAREFFEKYVKFENEDEKAAALRKLPPLPYKPEYIPPPPFVSRAGLAAQARAALLAKRAAEREVPHD